MYTRKPVGLLREGDQLPKVKDVSAALAINPDTARCARNCGAG